MAITEKKLADWAQRHDLKRLHKALKEYDYQVRLAAIMHLAKIGNRESIPHLDALIEDRFLVVLRAAHDAIKNISPSHESLSKFIEKIDQQVRLEENRKQRTEENFTPLTEEEERQKLEEAAQRVSVAKIYQKGLSEQKRKINHWKWVVFILLILSLLITLSRFVSWSF